MLASRAARDVPLRFRPASAAPFVAPNSGPVRARSWAIPASTLHRIRRGERALLAINLSLIAFYGVARSRGLAQALISTRAIFFAIRKAGAGWLLTKACFAVVWLAVLGSAGGAG